MLVFALDQKEEIGFAFFPHTWSFPFSTAC